MSSWQGGWQSASWSQEITRLQEELAESQRKMKEAFDRTEILLGKCNELQKQMDALKAEKADKRDLENFEKYLNLCFERRDEDIMRLRRDFSQHDDAASAAGSIPSCSAAGSAKGSLTGSTAPSTAAASSVTPMPSPVHDSLPTTPPRVPSQAPSEPPPPLAPLQGLALAMGRHVTRSDVQQLHSRSGTPAPSTPVSSAAPSQTGTPAPSTVGEDDDCEDGNPMYDIPPPPEVYERSKHCLEKGYHTPFFHCYRDPSIHSLKFGPTGGSQAILDQDFGGSWCNRLGSMNISLGNHPKNLLHNRLWILAKEKGVVFVVDGHNNTGGQMTSIACVQCGAYLKIEHDGLPAKKLAKPPIKLLRRVNQQLTKFVWRKEVIHRRRLLTKHGKYTCTIEHQNPGSVIDYGEEDTDEEEHEYA